MQIIFSTIYLNHNLFLCVTLYPLPRSRIGDLKNILIVKNYTNCKSCWSSYIFMRFRNTFHNIKIVRKTNLRNDTQKDQKNQRACSAIICIRPKSPLDLFHVTRCDRRNFRARSDSWRLCEGIRKDPWIFTSPERCRCWK